MRDSHSSSKSHGKSGHDADESGDDRVRLDKWLWAARFYKTRGIASEAIASGKIEVNGDRPKPAKTLKVGDEVRLRQGPYEHILIVRILSDRRGPATVAQTLYSETEASKAERERLSSQLKMAPPAFVFEEKGRPTKKDRRDLSNFIDRTRDKPA
ncbi:MAG: RNA-binding S4 domain-containing protein [Gemmatimonadaceae bacterium]